MDDLFDLKEFLAGPNTLYVLGKEKKTGSVAPVVYVVDWYGRRTTTTVPVTPAGADGWRVALGDTAGMWFEVVWPGATSSASQGAALTPTLPGKQPCAGKQP